MSRDERRKVLGEIAEGLWGERERETAGDPPAVKAATAQSSSTGIVSVERNMRKGLAIRARAEEKATEVGNSGPISPSPHKSHRKENDDEK